MNKGAIIIGVVIALKQRFEELKEGEIDEAEIKGYTEMLVEARQLATKRMVDEAEELGADAVIGLRYGSSQVMDGAAEVLAYGTAVKIIEKK